MHINLNATLLIQVIHFGIAYVLIRSLLLKPALKVKNEEQFIQEKTIYFMEQTREQIEQDLSKQQELLLSCHTYYLTNKPPLRSQSIMRIASEYSYDVELSPQEKNAAIMQATKLIEKK